MYLWEIIFMGIAGTAIIVAFTVMGINQKKHLKEQQADNSEKREMLDLMSRVMQEEYGKYAYVVGYYTKIQQKLGSTTYYYFPYVLAFTESEMIVFPFIKKEGRLYVRNRLDVDWNVTKLQYRIRKNSLLLRLKIAGEDMPINLNPVIKGTGTEKSDRPLCVFQEKEYEKLVAYLPGYKSMAK